MVAPTDEPSASRSGDSTAIQGSPPLSSSSVRGIGLPARTALPMPSPLASDAARLRAVDCGRVVATMRGPSGPAATKATSAPLTSRTSLTPSA